MAEEIEGLKVAAVLLRELANTRQTSGDGVVFKRAAESVDQARLKVDELTNSVAALSSQAEEFKTTGNHVLKAWEESQKRVRQLEQECQARWDARVTSEDRAERMALKVRQRDKTIRALRKQLRSQG